MEECVFCKIIKKELPAYVVYEDENAIAFLDIAPLSEGHTLVVPKKHYSRLTDMPIKDARAFLESVYKVAKIIEEKISKDYNIIVNQGRTAGQVINHLHVHIVPRYGNEQIFIWKSHQLNDDEAKRILEKLKQ